MRYFLHIFLLLLFVMIFSGCHKTDNAPSSKIDYIHNMASKYVESRNVEIWLPRQYFQNPEQHFPVLYMHDGQNVFNASSSNLGVAWDADDTAQKLIDSGKIQPVIIVAIWCTTKRRQEYFPEKAANYFTEADKANITELEKRFGESGGPHYLADNYLQFLVKELKPMIDTNYRTLADKSHTFIAGSSMGGLASMYAVAEYPDIFGKAACLSTHWPILANNDNMSFSESVRKYMIDRFPIAGDHQIYFDFGTETLDQYYEVHQTKVDAIMREKGYIEGKDWVTKKFPGAAHSEVFWQQRMGIVLEFLLAK